MGSDDEYGDKCSVISDKGEIGFIDYDDDRSICSYNPVEEGPIEVSIPFPFLNNQPRSIPAGSTSCDRITIKNTTPDPVDLWAVKIYASKPEGTFTLSLTEPQRSDGLSSSLESESLDDRVLQPGETLSVWLSCKPKEVGLHTSVVHFDLEDDTVERLVFLLADDNISRGLASRTRYTRGQRKKKQFNTETFVTAPRVPRANPKVVRNRMPRYEIPRETRDFLETKVVPDVVKEGLSEPSNYVDYFKTLVIMEELQLERDMSCYHMENVRFGRRGSQFLSLEVPGLAERRPSLVHGDYIFAKLASQCGNDTSPPFQGSIHRVESDEIHLRFAPEFHSSYRDGNLYNVQFTFNRVNMRRLYQAIDATLKLDCSFLFPTEQQDRRQINRSPLVPISRTLNEEQTCSVEMILGCEGSPPYVIHGPPGTGKTVTLVEAILQVCKSQKRPRILVCAPSNSAADHILEKLIQVNPEKVKVKPHEIFRLNASARPSDEINPDLAQFCFFEEEVFKCPPVEYLARFKIIISTYMSSSLLHAEGLRRGHFGHIFLDEAGQASEPEAMISVANFCLETTVVVLAGDPLQLGPVIYSKEADSHGLGKSYLERIFKFEPYDDMDYNYVTKLVRNYRCHHEILHLPSELFYEGELIACREEMSPFMRNVDFLPSREFPVLFFGIQGCDEREGSNPSWFNRFEVSKIVELVKRLTKNQDLNNGDIGVITPYRQQVTKVKTALENLDWTEVKVGSVEQFQGQEKQVIIVSTVRSTIRHNEFDKNHCLGFLSNPRRFNVAITRAISLLIIIGNPHIICKDAYWNKLLWRCIDNNSYRGCDPPERQELAEQEPSLENYEPKYQNQDSGSSRRDIADWVKQEFGSSERDVADWVEQDSGPSKDAPEWIEQSSETELSRPGFEVPPDFPEPTGWGD